MFQFTLEDVINYKIQTVEDLQQAFLEIGQEVMISFQLQREFMLVVKRPASLNGEAYQRVIRSKTATHGLSLAMNKRNELILTHYTFKKGA